MQKKNKNIEVLLKKKKTVITTIILKLGKKK